MKKSTAYGIVLTLLLIAVSLGCQSNPPSNTANSNSGTDHSGHDMSNMNGNSMANMNGHDMSKMDHDAKSVPGAADQPFDLQFIDSMAHHHAGAIAMAEMVLRKTDREELKEFARKIKEDQENENARMKSWRDQWYPGKPSAMNMELEGMKMGTMSDDHAKMMEAMGKEFDTHFLDMMIPHHEGAVKMSRELLARGEHAELKSLAEEIIKEQESEIKKMKAWKAEWSK